MLKKITDFIYVFPYRKRGDRPNLYYIKGDNYSIAVDAGNCKEHLFEFYQDLINNGFSLPKYTIISHWHWDHTFALNYIHGISISSAKTFQQLENVKKWKWSLPEMKKRQESGLDVEMCNKNILIEYRDLNDIIVKNTDLVVKNKKTLNLGNIKVQLICKESTHSDDSLFVYIPKVALFVQDADWINPYISDEYDQQKLINMINFFESLDYKYHLLGHVEFETKEQAINRLKGCIVTDNC